jgi:hypothetical protein
MQKIARENVMAERRATICGISLKVFEKKRHFLQWFETSTYPIIYEVGSANGG